MDLDSSTHAGGIVYGTMTVVGHELGLKRICLDSVANPRYFLQWFFISNRFHCVQFN